MALLFSLFYSYSAMVNEFYIVWLFFAYDYRDNSTHIYVAMAIKTHTANAFITEVHSIISLFKMYFIADVVHWTFESSRARKKHTQKEKERERK